MIIRHWFTDHELQRCEIENSTFDPQSASHIGLSKAIGIKLICTIKQHQQKDQAFLQLVDKQARDEGLWFKAETAPEGYLQQELRKLHDFIEKRIHA